MVHNIYASQAKNGDIYLYSPEFSVDDVITPKPLDTNVYIGDVNCADREVRYRILLDMLGEEAGNHGSLYNVEHHPKYVAAMIVGGNAIECLEPGVEFIPEATRQGIMFLRANFYTNSSGLEITKNTVTHLVPRYDRLAEVLDQIIMNLTGLV